MLCPNLRPYCILPSADAIPIPRELEIHKCFYNIYLEHLGAGVNRHFGSRRFTLSVAIC